MQKIMLTGNIGKDPEMKVLQSGDTLLTFDFAAKHKEKNEWVSTWYRCSLFGKRASSLAPMLHKGKKLTVVGELTAKLNEGKNGKSYMNLNVRVDDIDLGAKEDDGSGHGGDGGGQAPRQQQRSAPAQQQSEAPAEEQGDPNYDGGDDSIPF